MRERIWRSGVAGALLGVLVVVGGTVRTAGQEAASGAPASVDMTLAKPEAVGFSAERLERLHALMQGVVDAKELPGAVTILARHGRGSDYRT
jgi:hypothetical protein